MIRNQIILLIVIIIKDIKIDRIIVKVIISIIEKQDWIMIINSNMKENYKIVIIILIIR